VHTFRRYFVAAVVGPALVLTGCGGHPEAHRSIASVAVPGGTGYEPTPITVDKDDNVILSVGNATAVVHGFSIEGYGIRDEIQPGAPTQVKFKATHPGTFKIYCQLHEGHKVATLVVQ
jgi:heme/copper-type cytochrome/quinol oxidase subunit 2